METLLGSTEVVESVFDAFRSAPKLGMIAPQHFEAIRYSAGWGKNFEISEKIAQKMGIKISKSGPIDFPSGSMFWARTAALKPLLNSNFSIDDFPDEVGQVDETLAHAIERLFFFSCEQAGYRWLKISHSKFLGNSREKIVVADQESLLEIINCPLRKLIE
jgi:lipopolysaccharide biosynthesis protein